MLDASKYLDGVVISRREISPDLWAVRIKPSAPFAFKPGQYATLAVADDEGVHERPYSIVSGPHEPDLEFFFELVPQGEVTPRLYRLGVGDHLGIRRSAKGLFVLNRKLGHSRHLMVCTVTGVAPFVSMLRSWAHDSAWAPAGTQILLLEAASRSWEFGYADELKSLAGRLSNVQVHFSVSRHWEDAAWSGERGRAEDLVRKYADAAGFSAGQTAGYLCGHPQMIENAKAILQRCGFAKQDLHEEIYFVLPKSDKAAQA